MADLPISTAAVAHAHLDPIMALVRAEYPTATAQIVPHADREFPHTEILVTIDEDTYGLTVRADTGIRGFSTHRKASVIGYTIGKGSNISYSVSDNRKIKLRKNGTFDYAALAGLITGSARADTRAREARRQHAENKAATAEIFPQIEAMLLPGSRVSVRSKPGAPLELNIDLRVEVSAEDALELARRIHDWQNNYRKD